MRRILWATAAIGLSSIVVVALGAVRYKFIAIEVGAQGVGLLGILTSAANFGVILFSLGMGTSGVQAVAAAMEDPVRLQRVRRALLVASRWLGVAGGLAVILIGVALGGLIVPVGTSPLVLVAVGVALFAMVMSGAQLGLLNGLGRVRTLAICNTSGAVVGTGVTVVAVELSGSVGIIAALAAAPLATLVCSSWFVAREPSSRPPPAIRQWWPELRGLVSLGGVVMLGLLITSGTQLAIRVWIEQTDGLAAAGQFQAAWTITSMYLGFVLTALAVEYFPRISAQVADTGGLNASVDAQARIALILAAPVLLWMMVFAPFVLEVLYSSEFRSAAELLRWQLAGDVLKIVSWAVAFLLLARRARGAFFFGELGFNVAYLALGVWIAPQRGLVGLGVAYVGAYAIYVVITLILARKQSGFSLRPLTWGVTVLLLVLTGAVMWALENGTRLGFVVAVVIASLVSVGATALIVRMWATDPQAKRRRISGA